MTHRIVVRTGCRLHFGLANLGHDPTGPQFGGVGVMVDVPGVQLELQPCERFVAQGPLNERVQQFVNSILHNLQMSQLPELEIRVISAPREHVGLGVGSQLGLAVAAGLAEALGFPWRDPLRLCQLTGRGRRSAVGTYGFLLGGLIVDGGHLSGEPLGKLSFRCELPAEWRFALLTPPTAVGFSGLAEEQALGKLAPVSEEVTRELQHTINEHLIPAAELADFLAFSEAVFHYGCLAGKCFASAQGGTFASPETERLILWLREQGYAGVGQSSWGPTVFVVLRDQAAATTLSQAISNHATFRDYECLVGPAANRGVEVEVEAK